MPSVLIVEGEAIVARMLAEVFTFKGWRAETHSEKTSTLDALASNRHYDVIVTSYRIPGTSGVELARIAAGLDHRRTTPIVLITGLPVRAM